MPLYSPSSLRCRARTYRKRIRQLYSRDRDRSKDYVYQPLDESNNEIRLITLLPAADRDSEVICDLNIVRLTEEDVPQYEALSYTWGSAESPRRLRVSSSSDYSIDITENLAKALPYLRDPVVPRILWIDAIAINQKDLTERGQQVQRMADIFSLAERVIVWLGLGDADSKMVMETCEFLATKVEVDVDRQELRSLSDQAHDAHWSDSREQPPYDIATWQAIVNFLSRPWFQRLWIWQEIRLAKTNAMITCGADTMHWAKLQILLCCIVYKRSVIPWKTQESEDAATLLNLCFRLASAFQERLLSLFIYMRHSRCIDPRDRVYGILGLSSRTGTRIDLRPDYERPVIDVYIDLMIHYTNMSNRLDMLGLCRYDETMRDWPSWTPDLRTLVISTPTQSHASGSSACEVALLQDRVLRVTGLRLGRITSVDSFDGSREDCNSNIQRWAKSLDMASDYVDGKSMAEAFCLGICGGAVSDLYVPPSKTLPSLESRLAFLQDIVTLGDNEVDTYQGEHMLSEHVFQQCDRRAFFRTSSNHLGIGPSDAREDDHICVLLGCNASMIIRAVSDGSYKVIGESYVSGIGNTEAFLGPLSGGFSEVLRYDADSGHYCLVFLHTESGKIQVEDPRLSTELPSGWRRKTDAQGQFWQQFSHESAPDAWRDHDPRLTKSELLKRGVLLEDIEFS